MKKVKQQRFVTYFYRRKYLIRHLLSECGIDVAQINTKTNKELRKMLWICRNPMTGVQ